MGISRNIVRVAGCSPDAVTDRPQLDRGRRSASKPGALLARSTDCSTTTFLWECTAGEVYLALRGSTKPSIFSKEKSISAPKVCRLHRFGRGDHGSLHEGVERQHGSSMIASARSPFCRSTLPASGPASYARRTKRSAAGCYPRGAPLRPAGSFSPPLGN